MRWVQYNENYWVSETGKEARTYDYDVFFDDDYVEWLETKVSEISAENQELQSEIATLEESLMHCQAAL